MDLAESIVFFGLSWFIISVRAIEINCPKEFVVCDCVEEKEHGIGESQTLEINCSERNLTEVPDWTALRGLPITWVDLSDNNLKKLPADAFIGLTFASPKPAIWIPRLDINHNPLSIISPYAFRNMRGDGILLHMRHTRMRTFPSEALRNIENLTDLFFMSSHVRDIPSDSFKGFRVLRRIDLSGNKVEFLRSGLFNGLEDMLKSLYLNKMDLSEFPWRALHKLRALWDLKLDGNNIKHLDDNIFVNFETKSDLFVLSLKHNDLTTISPKAFRRSKLRLCEIYLSHNNISDITFLEDPCSLTFSTYGHINLEHNYFHCDCNLFSILKAGFYDLHGRCKSPKMYIGIPWISKDYDTLASRECTWAPKRVKTWNLYCMTSSNMSHTSYVFSPTTIMLLLLSASLHFVHW